MTLPDDPFRFIGEPLHYEERVMFTRTFWKKATERAVKTAAQSAILVFGADQVNALNANWDDVAGFALGGFVLSYLFSLATSGTGPDEDPSAV